jgi:hypothetical protein
VITSGARLIVIDNNFVPVCEALSVTFTVKFDVPTAVGVPVIDPAVDNVSPAGNDPEAMDHE